MADINDRLGKLQRREELAKRAQQRPTAMPVDGLDEDFVEVLDAVSRVVGRHAGLSIMVAVADGRTGHPVIRVTERAGDVELVPVLPPRAAAPSVATAPPMRTVEVVEPPTVAQPAARPPEPESPSGGRHAAPQYQQPQYQQPQYQQPQYQTSQHQATQSQPPRYPADQHLSSGHPDGQDPASQYPAPRPGTRYAPAGYEAAQYPPPPASAQPYPRAVPDPAPGPSTGPSTWPTAPVPRQRPVLRPAPPLYPPAEPAREQRPEPPAPAAEGRPDLVALPDHDNDTASRLAKLLRENPGLASGWARDTGTR